MEIQGPNPLDQYQHEEDDQQPIEVDPMLRTEQDANLMEVDHSTSYLLGDDVTVRFQPIDEDNQE